MVQSNELLAAQVLIEFVEQLANNQTQATTLHCILAFWGYCQGKNMVISIFVIVLHGTWTFVVNSVTVLLACHS